MNDFINYFSSHFGIFLLVLARMSSLFLSFPLTLMNFLPLNIRIMFLLSLSFFILPYIEGAFNLSEISLISFLLLVLKEILTGFFLSLVTWIFYSIAVYSSELISYMMGLTIVNIFDPTFGMVSVLGRFFIFLFLIVFFSTGAYQIFFGAIFESFKIIPIGGFSISDSLLKFFIREGTLLFYLGFKLAFPFIFTLFIVNLALALINRLIPQINVFIVGLPLQLYIGILFLLLGFNTIIHFFRILNERFIDELLSVIKLLGG
jgi:flagellar biosynthetic protein FliR